MGSGITFSGDSSTTKAFIEKVKKAIYNTRIKVVDSGAEAAQRGYDSSFHTGSMDITVVAEHGENESTVHGYGEQIIFTEFGTGVTWLEEHPNAAEYGYFRGEYGKGNGKNPKGWFFKGEPGNWASPAIKKNKDGSYTTIDGVYFTKGQPASKSMYYDFEEMEKFLPDIFEEEMRKI